MAESASTLSPDVILVMGEQVVQAARDFSEALSETTQYQAWEQAAWSLRQDQAAQSLAEKLQARQRELEPLLMLGAASAPVRAYLDASTDLETNAEATGLLDELAQRQAALRVKQDDGGLSQADIDGLRVLQFRVQTQPTIAAYLQAQQDLRALLPQINYEISQLLGVDFAALARKSGCC